MTVPDWPATTTQPGDELRTIFGLMGADVMLGARRADGQRDAATSSGADLDLHDVGELTPVIAAVAALADGPSYLRGIAHLRGHETDRLAALTDRAERARLRRPRDRRTASRSGPQPLTGGVFRTYHDHRMAHAAAVLGLVVAGVRDRERRHHVQDPPGLRRRLDGDADDRRVGEPSDVSPTDYGDLDDFSRFDRPRRRTRPRTKDRPTYDDAVSGLVVTVDRGRFTIRLDGDRADRRHRDELAPARPQGSRRRRRPGPPGRRRQRRRRAAWPGSSRSSERTTVLRRTADDTDPVERIVVANADQLVVVTAVANPEPRPRLIDRALVAAFDAGIDPLLCLTKVDLADPEPLLSIYRPLGVPHVVAERGSDLAELRAALHDRVSVFVGHSGVGKSTLVNALVPGTDRATGHVNVVTGRGRHTSTSALALELPSGGWVIDTPGIRSFGLAHVDPAHLIEAFDDLHEVTVDCPRGCTHGATEPECALDEAIADGRVEAERVESFRRLLASRERTEGD